MRTRSIHMIAIMAVVVLASGTAWAQAPQPMQERTNTGSFTVAGVLTSVDGEEARYQRYTDLSDGVDSDFDLTFESGAWLTEVTASAVGRRDQQYFASIEQQGKFGLSLEMTGIPVFYSERIRNPYTENNGVLTIDTSVRQQLAGGTLALDDYINGLPRSEALAERFQYLVDLYGFITPEWEATGQMKIITKTGEQPYFGSFGFSDVVEIPLPLDHRTTNVTLGTEWGNQKALARVEYLGSWFDNDLESVIWDQPDVLTDRNGATSRGRLTTWPSNTYQSVSGTGSVALAGRSRLTGTLAAGVMDQDATLVPHTINSALEVPLDRTTAQAEATTLFANINFTSRPADLVRFKARYRYRDLDKTTPVFEVEQFVRMDYALGHGSGATEPYSVKTQSFDAEVSLVPTMAATLFAGYGYEKGDRTFRILPELSENRLWVGFDSIGSQYVTLRTKYEYSTRDGDVDHHLLEEIPERAEMRHFDIAARDRNRVIADLSLLPTPSTGVSLSYAYGKDEYNADLQDSTIPQLGLLDNKHNIVTLAFNAVPRDDVFVDVYYVYEDYDTLQRNHTANPGPLEQDPTLAWTDDASDEVHTFGFNLDATQVRDIVDLGFGWVYTDAESLYHYEVESGLPLPEQLPPVENTLNRFTADAKFWINQNIALGAVYWFDKYQTQDLANDGGIGAVPEAGNGQLLGYFYEPYTANTFWLTLTYAWQ